MQSDSGVRVPHLRVLCVDNSEDDLVLAARALRRDPRLKGRVAFTGVSSGAEGLKKVKEIDPDLVISDMQMPGMDGACFIRAMQRDPRFARTPVVFHSGGMTLAQRLEVSDLMRRHRKIRVAPKSPFGEALVDQVVALSTRSAPWQS